MTRIETIADGVWGVQTVQPIGLGASLPLRMTVVKDDQGLLLFAPIAIDDALAAELADLGPVHTLIAPNRLHHRHIAAAKGRYRAARMLGAPGLAKKKPQINFDGALAADNQPSPALRTLLVEGADKLSEVVFLHEPSRTLIVTDLVFNIPDAAGMSWVILKALSRALGPCEQSRLLRTMTNDRGAAGLSIAQLLSWSFDRVVPAHGNVVESDAAETLKAALWWMRGESRRPN